MPETFHSQEQVKAFILYLLEKIGYPLEYNDLASIVLRDGFVDYFDFVKNFHELLSDGHIRARDGAEEDGEESPEGGTEDGAAGADPAGTENAPEKKPMYSVSDSGRMIARGLADDLLLTAVREKSYISAMRHLSLEKRGAVWNHSIEKDGDGYIFHCSIRDCDGLAFQLDLRADSFPQAERMRMNFEDKPDVVFRGIVAMVTGNVNYLFEK